MKKVTLIPYISLAFIYHTVSPIFGGLLPVLFFAPFFSTLFSRSSLFVSLWTSFFVGFFLDLSTTSTPLGFYPVCCILSALLLHKYKIYFFEEKPVIFSLYTGLYSFVYTILFYLLYCFFDTKLVSFNLYFLIDLICLPIIDMLYHLAFFTLPVFLYLQLNNRKTKRFFLRAKRNVMYLLNNIILKVSHVYRKRTN